jgi:hypothetical protein
VLVLPGALDRSVQYMAWVAYIGKSYEAETEPTVGSEIAADGAALLFDRQEVSFDP